MINVAPGLGPCLDRRHWKSAQRAILLHLQSATKSQITNCDMGNSLPDLPGYSKSRYL